MPKTSTLYYALYLTVTIVGVILFTLGLILATMGPTAIQQAYSEEILVTKKLANSSVYSVNAEGFRYFSLNLSSGELVVGSVTVTRGSINFYVMTRQQYEAWRNEERPSGLITQKMMRSYNFSLTPPNDGEYYFLLDNSDSPIPKQVNISDINSTLNQTITKYRAAYDYTLPIIGFGSLIAGAVSTIVGLIKKPKPLPKEPEKQPLSLGKRTQLLLPYLFLLGEAVNGFFGSLLVINWLAIEFYQNYSPRIINLIIFSPAVDWWIWAGSLIFVFTVPYALMKISGTTVLKPLIPFHLTLPVALILYLANLQYIATPILLIGNFLAIFGSIVYARKLLLMPRVKALIVFTTGLFGILIPIELASLIIWIQNTFDPRYPFDIDPRWRIPWIEVQISNLAFPVVSWLLLTFILSWIWVPLLKGIYSKFGTSGVELYTESSEQQGSKHLFPKLGLLFSIICGVYLTYAPYVFNNQGVRGIDTLWYYQTLDQIKNVADLKALLLNEPRGIYLSLLYFIRLITSQSSLTVVQITPALLAITLVMSTYYFVKVGTKNESLAVISSIFATFSFYITVGMYTGIFGNWLAMSMILMSFTLFLKALEKRSKLYLATAGLASLAIFLVHRWTWGVTMGIYMFYLLFSLVYFTIKESNAKSELSSALLVIIINLSPALIAGTLSYLASSAPIIATSSINALWRLLTEYLGFFNIIWQLLPNISYTLRFYVGGCYNNSFLIILSIVGLIATATYKENFNRILTAWVFAVSIVLSFYWHLPTTWRFLYVLPFPITAASGISFITDKVRQRILASPSVNGSDNACFLMFQVSLIVLIILFLFNYATRCLALIY